MIRRIALTFTAVLLFPVLRGLSQTDCSAGTVNAGAGAVADVLFVNGQCGVATVGVGEPIVVREVAAPEGPASARYALWAWRSCPTGSFDVIVNGTRLGCTLAPSPFNRPASPQPFRCLRGGLGSAYCFGVTELHSPSRAPWSLTKQQGFALEVDFTLQGVIEDSGASNAIGLSVTNAVVLRVRSAAAEAPPDAPVARPFVSSACGSAVVPPQPRDLHAYSGEFTTSAVDLRIPGRGIDFVWSRSYRSQLGPPTAQGNGWDFSYHLRIERQGSHVRLFDGNGRADLYLLQPGGTYTRKEFFREGRFNPDGTFTLTFEDTGKWNFRAVDGSLAQGKVASIVDRNGNALAFAYDAAGRLAAITDTLGRIVTVGYTTDGHIAAVTDFIGRQVLYDYYAASDLGGSSGDLRSATSPIVVGTPNGNDFSAGKTTVYTYSRGFADPRLNHNLLAITDPKSQTMLVNSYAATTHCADRDFDRLVTQTRGNPGETLEFVYVAQTPSPSNNQAVIKSIVNDRVGDVKEYFFDAAGRCVIRREYTGRAVVGQPVTDSLNRPAGPLRPDDPAFFETRYEYNVDSLATRITRPNGDVTRNVYELELNPSAPWRARGNLRERHRLAATHVPAGDQTEIVERFEYDSGFGGCCGTNFVTRHTDGRGNVTIHSYDPAGNRVHTSHRIASIAEDWEYNAFGQMTAHVRPDNGNGSRRRDVFTYYGPADGVQNGYLRSGIVDAPNFALTTTHEYDAVGNVIRRIDPQGHDTLFAVNALNQVVRETSREVTDGSGIRYRRDTFYDADDNVVRVDVENRDENGVVQPNAVLTTTTDYEILNQPIRVTREVDPSHSVVTEYAYDANRNRTLVRNGEATNGNDPFNEVRTLYDERDLPFRKTRAPGSSSPSTIQWDYDGNGNRRGVKAGLEGTPYLTTDVYDGYDRRMQSTDAMGNVTDYHYDANGNLGGDRIAGSPNPFAVRVSGELVDVPGSAGNVRLSQSMFEYDAMDRRTRERLEHFDTQTQAPIGDGQSITQTQWSAASQITRTIDDNGHATDTSFDTANRRRQVTDPKGNTLTMGYDSNSNVVQTTEVDRSDLGNPDRTIVTTFAYDNLDRLVRMVDNAGNATAYRYDSRDNPVGRTDPRGNGMRTVFDGLDRAVQSIRQLTDSGDGNGNSIGSITTTKTFDDDSRLVSETDDNGNATQYAYDALDRRTRVDFADCTASSVAYDVHDNAVMQSDANGTVTTCIYDRLERVTNKNIGVGPGDTTFEAYQYDGRSRLVRAQDDDSAITATYDSRSNVTRETQQVLPGGIVRTVSATFDGKRNRSRLVYPSGRTLVTTYDPLDRPGLIRDDPPGPGSTIATFAYFGPDQVERRDFGNGTRLEFDYDVIRRPVHTLHSRISDGFPIDERVYGWDAASNKQFMDSLIPNPDPHIYSYDSVDRLVRTNMPVAGCFASYDLDGVGNRRMSVDCTIAGPYTIDTTLCEPADFQMNQYTTTAVDGRLYDRNGNLTETHSAPRQFAYDFRNRLIRFTDVGTGQTTTYRSDCLGRRIEQNVAGNVTRFVYSGWQEIEEETVSGSVVATTVWGAGSNEILQMHRSGQVYFFHADDLGSTRALTNASGSVIERYRYGDFGLPHFLDAFGNAIPATAVGNAFLFTGHRFDAQTGLYWLLGRYLDPVAGRLTTRATTNARAFSDMGSSRPANAGARGMEFGEFENAFSYLGDNPTSRAAGMGWNHSVSSLSSFDPNDLGSQSATSIFHRRWGYYVDQNGAQISNQKQYRRGVIPASLACYRPYYFTSFQQRIEIDTKPLSCEGFDGANDWNNARCKKAEEEGEKLAATIGCSFWCPVQRFEETYRAWGCEIVNVGKPPDGKGEDRNRRETVCKIQFRVTCESH